ncbi:AAA ATPase central domain protein [Pyrolobus fumarii 1A]|uniref:AAA ATPase central domain protein n=1 Tax=Pyrolobus fumarii (strain DSM 11204 / 1A) TaxID=694429 RepID=G0EE75_PYRF1|nr:cell division protein CdvC [Pyrolobus fumarii]AEM38769.1 AAA ATPase central domain protein [Pyrolobus fumarii 1A]
MTVLAKLENMARRYVVAAVEADRAGRYDEAITNYKKAIELLAKIVRLYPDYPLSRTYAEMIKKYRTRVQQLESRRVPAAPVEAGVSDENSDEEWLVTEKPRVTFDDIVDLEEAKRAIIEAIVYPVRRPDLFPLGWPRGILLFGPPGCGKTMLAAAVANEVDGHFFHVDAASIMSKWLGEAEKKVKKLFAKARKLAEETGKPSIIFIDEVDALLGVHSTEVGGEVRVRNQFLKEMDGLQDKDKKLHVYVIAATNKPWRLDQAFIRRFQKRIYIPPPNKEVRKQLFLHYTSKIRVADDVDFDKLAEMTEGYSASDIRDVVMEAYMRTVRELFEEKGGVGEPRPVAMEDFIEVLKRRGPSISPDVLRAYEEWFRRFRAV